MLFQRFEDEGLAQYSYAVGCPACGDVAIVDPCRDADVYTRFAEEEGLRITHVLETHIHADFASGARELAERTGARLLVSGHDEGERYEVAFDHEDVRHGNELTLGSVRIRALHTPGHTPEHLSYLVFDRDRSEETPMLLLSGDFLLVGSLGRPDLLGEQVKHELAGQLYDSVHGVLAKLPDGLEVHPAHGAGSMCGSGMSGRQVSTLGFERSANPYLETDLGREDFVNRILGSAPPYPDYYRRMKRVNSEGPPLLDGLPGLRPVAAERFSELAGDGDHLVIDLRDHLAFGGAHVPGSFGIGAGPNLSTWASWVVPYERPLLLVAEHESQVDPSVRALVRVGLDQVVGYLEGGIEAWRNQGLPMAEVPQVPPRQLADRIEKGPPVRVLDVRSDEEWESGHIQGAHHVMLGELPDRIDEVERDGVIATICGSGYRSTVAASILLRHGFVDVLNVPGGMTAWKVAGLPVEE